MSIDANTVKRIAHLARLRLDEAAVEPMKNEINGILAFVEQLSEVDTTDVEPMTSAVAQRLRWRDDVVNDGGIQDAVLRNAPEAQFGFYAVPKVIE